MRPETEFKLRAARPIELASIDAALREAGVDSRASARRLHVDLYLDDTDHSLGRAGIGLRLRIDSNGSMLCCKTRGHSEQGLFVRDEHECAWPQREAPINAHDLPTALRDRIEPFTLDRRLAPVLRLETQRDVRHLRLDDQDLCELAVDHVEATGGGRSTTFFEVELEVVDDVPGNERLAHHLIRSLPLQPAVDDKPTHAASCLGLHRPAQPAATECTTMPLADGVITIVGDKLAAMRRAESRVRDDHDAVHLHTMRVELRRLRCFVRAFESAWPPATSGWLLDQLALTSRRLGTVRDLDVLLQGLPFAAEPLPSALQSSIEEVRGWMQRERSEAHRQLLAWLSSSDRLAAEAEIERRLLTIDRPDNGTVTKLGAAVPSLLSKAVTRVKKRIANLDLEQATWPVHELRIATKHLRYLVEQFANEANQDRHKGVRLLTRLQQSLGEVRDHELATERLLAWLSRAAHADHKAVLLGAALGGLATQHATLAKRARKRARRWLRRLDRKRSWRRLGAPVGG